jgi:acyl-coenzyme A thioesterase PaaI-like protein
MEIRYDGHGAALHSGHPGVTGRLAVSYRRPLKLGEPVRVVGKVEREGSAG